MRKSSAKAAAPFSKEKVKEAVSILEVARKYSPQINERAKRPKIICPFHEDRHLGSCRIFTDTNTFKCEACGAHGDTLTLASGYLGIKPTALNELLEKIVAEFSIIPDTVRVDYSSNTPIAARPPERLSPEEYCDHFKSGLRKDAKKRGSHYKLTVPLSVISRSAFSFCLRP